MAEDNEQQVIYFLAQGLEKLESGDYAGAREMLSQALKLDPNNPDVLTYYGMVEINEGNIDEGISYFDRAIDVAPNNPEPFIYKAQVFFSLGMYKEAAQIYNIVLSMDSGNEYAREGLEACREYIPAEEFQKIVSGGGPQPQEEQPATPPQAPTEPVREQPVQVQQAEELAAAPPQTGQVEEFPVVEEEGNRLITLVKRKLDIVRNNLIELKSKGIDISELKNNLKVVIMNMEADNWEAAYEALTQLESSIEAETIGWEYRNLGEFTDFLQQLVALDINTLPDDIGGQITPYFNAATNIFKRVIGMLEADEKVKASEYYKLNLNTLKSIKGRIDQIVGQWSERLKSDLVELKSVSAAHENAGSENIAMAENLFNELQSGVSSIDAIGVLSEIEKLISHTRKSIETAALKKRFDEVEKRILDAQNIVGIDRFTAEFDDILMAFSGAQADFNSGQVEKGIAELEEIASQLDARLEKYLRQQAVERLSTLERDIDALMNEGVPESLSGELNGIIEAITAVKADIVGSWSNKLNNRIEEIEGRIKSLKDNVLRVAYQKRYDTLEEMVQDSLADTEYMDEAINVLDKLQEEIDTLSPGIEEAFMVAEGQIKEMISDHYRTIAENRVNNIKEMLSTLPEEHRLEFEPILNEIIMEIHSGVTEETMGRLDALETAVETRMKETKAETLRAEIHDILSEILHILTDIKTYGGDWQTHSERIAAIKVDVESSGYDQLTEIKKEVEELKSALNENLVQTKKDFLKQRLLEFKEPLDRFEEAGVDISDLKALGKEIVTLYKSDRLEEAFQGYEEMKERIDELSVEIEGLEEREKNFSARLDEARNSGVDISDLEKRYGEVVAAQMPIKEKMDKLAAIEEELKDRMIEVRKEAFRAKLKEISRELATLEEMGFDVSGLKMKGKEMVQAIKDGKLDVVEVGIEGMVSQISRMKDEAISVEEHVSSTLEGINIGLEEIPEPLAAPIRDELKALENVPLMERPSFLEQISGAMERAMSLKETYNELEAIKEEATQLPDDLAEKVKPLIDSAENTIKMLEEPDLSVLRAELNAARAELERREKEEQRRKEMLEELSRMAETCQAEGLQDVFSEIEAITEAGSIDEAAFASVKEHFQEALERKKREEEEKRQRAERSSEVKPLIEEIMAIIDTISQMNDVPVNLQDLENAINTLNDYIDNPREGVIDSMKMFIDDMKSIVDSFKGAPQETAPEAAGGGEETEKPDLASIRDEIDMLYSTVDAEALLDVEELYKDAEDALAAGNTTLANGLVWKIKNAIASLKGEEEKPEEEGSKEEAETNVSDTGNEEVEVEEKPETPPEGPKPPLQMKKPLKPLMPLGGKIKKPLKPLMPLAKKAEAAPQVAFDKTPGKNEPESGGEESEDFDNLFDMDFDKGENGGKAQVSTPEEQQTPASETTESPAPTGDEELKKKASSAIVDYQMELMLQMVEEEKIRMRETLQKARDEFQKGNYQAVLDLLSM